VVDLAQDDEKEDFDDIKNVIEVHVRKKGPDTDQMLKDLKKLIDQHLRTVDLIIIDPNGEPIMVRPQTEATIKKKPTKYQLTKGNVYIIKDETPDRGFETFADVIRSQCHDCDKTGAFECEALDCSSCTIDCPCITCDRTRPQGLCITRRYPKKVAQQYLIQTTPMIWLTQMRKGDLDCLNPNEISRLNSTITAFIEASENGVILFEGLEYLITQNSFEIVLKFIQHIQDIIAPSKSCVIFSLDPLALDQEEVHILQRNMVDL
jgi:archaellum biogenesis ATPase FlaH